MWRKTLSNKLLTTIDNDNCIKDKNINGKQVKMKTDEERCKPLTDNFIQNVEVIIVVYYVISSETNLFRIIDSINQNKQ